jgi:hypothetical protein
MAYGLLDRNQGSGFLKSRAPSKVLMYHSVMLGRDALVGKDVECCNRQPRRAEPSSGLDLGRPKCACGHISHMAFSVVENPSMSNRVVDVKHSLVFTDHRACVLLNSICLDWRSLENHSMTLGRGDLQMRTLAASLVERAEPTGRSRSEGIPALHIDQIGHIGRLVAVSAT